jgi:hypothetical protein
MAYGSGSIGVVFGVEEAPPPSYGTILGSPGVVFEVIETNLPSEWVTGNQVTTISSPTAPVFYMYDGADLTPVYMHMGSEFDG